MGRGKRRTATRSPALRAKAASGHARRKAGPHGHGRLNPWVAEPCGHPHLPRIEVRSTLLTSVGYDDEKQIMEAEFHAGGIYQYHGVPLDVYEGIFTAASVGRYFNDEIKEKYPADAIHPSLKTTDSIPGGCRRRG